MFSYDLVHGHRWLVGDEKLLAGCAQHREPAAIPLAEGTRLLMNRATGLLLALERLRRKEFTAADADFVARNLAKAELALGDAVLVAHAQYRGSVRERHRRLLSLGPGDAPGWLPEVCARHAQGVEFKLHPQRSAAPREELLATHAKVSALAERVWLWFESHRLGRTFGSAVEYARHAPAPAGAPSLRNALVNVKVSGPRALFRASALRPPRECVLRTLPLLLWEPAALTTPALLEFAQRQLATDARDFAGLVRAYRERWQHVN
jgi:hypothetical protein